MVYRRRNATQLKSRICILFQELFLFVFCHPDAPDRFEIATNFPKRVLDCKDNVRETLSDVGLRRGEVLFVYDLEA